MLLLLAEAFRKSNMSMTDPTGPSTGSYRVRRGGGWLNLSDRCRSALRSRYSPDYRYYGLGFRVFRSSIK